MVRVASVIAEILHTHLKSEMVIHHTNAAKLVTLRWRDCKPRNCSREKIMESLQDFRVGLIAKSLVSFA